MKNRVGKIFIGSFLIVSLGVVAPGCEGLIGDLMSLLGFDILGVQPANNFGQTGQVNFALLGRSEDGTVTAGTAEDQCEVFIEHEDGSVNECSFVGENIIEANPYNSLVVLLDSSGSMERTYPEEEYGDLCLTCPHDAERMRVQAAQDLISVVHRAAPESHISVADFGPEPSEGMLATRILADFTTDTDTAFGAVGDVEGAEFAGTPMWDSLAELMGALDDDADAFENILRQEGRIRNRDGSVTTGNEPEVFEPNSGEDTDDTVVTEAPTTELPDSVERYIIVVSDGQDLDSETFTLDDVIAYANEHDVTVHAIGLGPASAAFDSPLLRSSQNQSEAVGNLERLAAETGGFYASVHDADALVKLYGNIAESLTQGYNQTTFDCVDETTGETVEYDSGDRVDGYIQDSNGTRESFSFIAP